MRDVRELLGRRAIQVSWLFREEATETNRDYRAVVLRSAGWLGIYLQARSSKLADTSLDTAGPCGPQGTGYISQFGNYFIFLGASVCESSSERVEEAPER